MPDKAPSTAELADAIRSCVQAYVNANQGSDAHPLGRAELGSLNDVLPHLKAVPSVKGGFAVRFKDGTVFLVNVHEMPKPQAPPSPDGASP